MNTYKVRAEGVEYTIKADYFKIENGNAYFYLYEPLLLQDYVSGVRSVIFISEK